MRVSVAFRVVAVYLVMSAITLGLAGILTNRTIKVYVINSTKGALIADSRWVIAKFENYHKNDNASLTNPLYLTNTMVAAQLVNSEYMIVNSSGSILLNNFSSKFPR